MTMCVKVHQFKDRSVVAIADKEIIGKIFTEKNLEINISAHFYSGEEKSKDEVIEILKRSSNLNLVGKETIQLALEHDIIDKESIITIQGIPHCCIFGL